MNDETIPGQLDTILSTLGSMAERLTEGDKRMNEADTLRSQMNDQLATHGTVLLDHGLKMDEQNTKLDKVIAGLVSLTTKMDANTASTKVVEDVLTTARVGRTVLVWFASIAGAIGALWGVWTNVKH